MNVRRAIQEYMVSMGKRYPVVDDDWKEFALFAGSAEVEREALVEFLASRCKIPLNEIEHLHAIGSKILKCCQLLQRLAEIGERSHFAAKFLTPRGNIAAQASCSRELDDVAQQIVDLF